MTVSVGFLTLGCPKNEVDSDRMKAATLASSYEVVDELSAADVVVVNTCSFIREATEESIEAVMELATGWKPAAANRRIIVAGCMATRYADGLADALTEADAFVPVAQEAQLLDVIAGLTGVAAGAESVDAPLRTTGSATAYLQIADGCHRSCTYCTIPSIRGPYRSRPLDELRDEAAWLVEHGARELILIGQDTSSWGHDLTGNERLSDLAAEIAASSGAQRIRLMYVQPDGVTDDLLAVMAETPSICHYLDIPLQHASRDVLQRMGRRGEAGSFLDLVLKVRTYLPDVTLRTSLIAGFPGETRSDAAELASFVQAAGFDYAGVFTYSPEDGTRAAELASQVSVRTKRARAQRLRDVAAQTGAARITRHVGTVQRVLAEPTDPDDGTPFGRTCGQAPDVDGVTILDREIEPGSMPEVRIVDSVGYDLVGEVLS